MSRTCSRKSFFRVWARLRELHRGPVDHVELLAVKRWTIGGMATAARPARMAMSETT